MVYEWKMLYYFFRFAKNTYNSIIQLFVFKDDL